ncbi:DedA family protein [Actinocatenispora rupis]|uniref:Membrane protein n=1 Tax=Actinocatenispora rupis TaxID=519421 RepID=A0A8J3J226_9ACTN|nr:DedA family protein [Actinocatenispora rupis]GID10675.1 membrane protein [Actinocatenispora rupis]
MHSVEAWLGSIPPIAVYGLLLLIIGIESMGIPLPGEIALVSASLLASTGAVSPWGVAGAAAAGAIIGDSIGYLIGRRGGQALFARLGRRFPKHLGPDKIARAELAFHRHGVWAVFFGRFVALLRILAGPIAGSLRMPYWKFLIANATGGIFWASATTAVIYFLGRAAERWLSDFSWALLALVLLGGAVTALVVRRRAQRLAESEPPEADPDPTPVHATTTHNDTPPTP